jgi:hypothetical protein
MNSPWSLLVKIASEGLNTVSICATVPLTRMCVAADTPSIFMPDLRITCDTFSMSRREAPYLAANCFAESGRPPSFPAAGNFGPRSARVTWMIRPDVGLPIRVAFCGASRSLSLTCTPAPARAFALATPPRLALAAFALRLEAGFCGDLVPAPAFLRDATRSPPSSTRP